MKELYRLRYSVLKRSWGHLILWICWKPFLDQSLNIHHQQTKKQTNATEKVTNKWQKCGAKELLGSLDPVDLLECFCDSQKIQLYTFIINIFDHYENIDIQEQKIVRVQNFQWRFIGVYQGTLKTISLLRAIRFNFIRKIWQKDCSFQVGWFKNIAQLRRKIRPTSEENVTFFKPTLNGGKSDMWYGRNGFM